MVKNQYFVLERENIKIEYLIRENKILNQFIHHFTIIKNEKYRDISSTLVRKYIQEEKKEIRKMIPTKVQKYIEENGLYRNGD